MFNDANLKNFQKNTKEKNFPQPSEKIQCQKINPAAFLPIKGTIQSAGFDLRATENYLLLKNKRILIKTGLKIAVPAGYYGRIAPRSGLAYKKGLDVLAGVIDADYRGEVGVILINLGEEDVEIKKGEAIAQIIFEKIHESEEMEEVEELNDTERGAGGYGSTDQKKI